MWQDSSSYASSSSQQPYYAAVPHAEPLQFYGGAAAPVDPNSYLYPGSRPSLDGHISSAQGNIGGSGNGYGGNIQSQGGWWTAFGTGGLEGEPPLLEGALYYTNCGAVREANPQT